MDPIHLRPTAELAERVLLPGDPGRALFLAQTLIDTPRMFNHHRGLWGYTGPGLDGEPLTIQATGMGGPSAAIVVSELIALGARRLVRVGTCGALAAGLSLGELLIAEEALCADGCSSVISGGDRARAAAPLVASLHEAAARMDPPAAAAAGGAVISTDLFYDPRGLEEEWRSAGILAVEMETATLFALAAYHAVEAASLLIVSDELFPERRRIGADLLREAEARAGRVALDALGSAQAW